MKDYQFKVGDKGKTRDGRKEYEVISISDRVDRGLVAVIKYLDDEQHRIGTWYPNGMFMPGKPQKDDLMPPTRTVYVNFYSNSISRYFDSEQHARAYPPLHCVETIAIAVPVEIPG